MCRKEDSSYRYDSLESEDYSYTVRRTVWSILTCTPRNARAILVFEKTTYVVRRTRVS